MSSIDKGNELENKFHEYLLKQKDDRNYIFGIYPPELCQIYKKKKYYCREREADVEFDIVVEVTREGSESPHLIVVFECKNHSDNIAESHITEFSDKLNRIFKHNAKGIMIVSAPLQSGAKRIIEKRKIGLVKYDETGFEIVLERSIGDSFIRKGFFEKADQSKPLIFSAYYGEHFFSSIPDLFRSLDIYAASSLLKRQRDFSVPYLSQADIKKCVDVLLEEINYKGGRVDLESICSHLAINLHYHNQSVRDGKGREILGFANFSNKQICLNLHENKDRERFTLGHEIGHFYLQHDRFLQSESLVEADLLESNIRKTSLNYERLEVQANSFSSHLLLPEDYFLLETERLRKETDIRDRGHGYIYVDDQPCNFTAYNSLLSALSLYFGASKHAIEIKFRRMNLLTDNRKH